MSLSQHLHPALVHFPITLLLVSSALGLACLFLWSRSELRRITWWAMALGWVATAIAIFTGLISQAGLPVDAPYRRTLNLHIGAGLGLLVIYGALLYLEWISTRTRTVRGMTQAGRELLDDPSRRWLVAGLLILGALVVIATGYWGGELVYLWGVNVGEAP